ncbi:MAG TPA: hypothetical protein VMS22_05595 [Candidatus Eisenbacteria bacterium]|nr:hypothetical protein [Candidatus Eisenbacteria bacterium]
MVQPGAVDPLEALKWVVDAAHSLARDLQGDELLARLVKVFEKMPPDDRPIVVGALEREVQIRTLSQDVAETLTQVELRPNPNARIYLRVIDQENANNEVETMAMMRAVHSVQRGIDALDPTWSTMMATTLREMDPTARERIDDFNRAMRVLLDEAASSAPPAREAAPPSEVTRTPDDAARVRK